MPLQLIFSTPEASRSSSLLPPLKAGRRRRAYEWARFQTGFNLTSTNMASGFSNMLQDYEQVLGADAAGTTITRIRGRIAWAYFLKRPSRSPSLLLGDPRR